MKQYRQGDVFIQEIETLPKDVKKQNSKGKIILALGEATGHHHSIEVTEATESFVDAAGLLFLNLKEDTVLTHQEHAPIEINRGTYKVTIQKEYTPQEIRDVQD
jgi:hypothetical protein